MPSGLATRALEAKAAAAFLTAASVGPSVLVIDGEPGIGKTTIWLETLDQAADAGFHVLSARPVAVESVLAYASLADLLGCLDASALANLPVQQRNAIDQVLARSNVIGAPTDQRAVAAAFLSVIEGLSDRAPVLLAIDDLQWLDPSSAQVIAFAARRISGRVGVFATVRADAESQDAASWLDRARPGSIARVRLGPLALGQLHAVVSQRLGRTFSRPMVVRIHEVTGGNPFYAIELGRTLDGQRPLADVALPNTLVELVRARVGNLDADVRNALLAVACLATPTVEVVAEAIGTPAHRLVELLQSVETNGIIAIDGNRLRFGHPLWARGVYTDAAPAQRRAMHQSLAGVVNQPELRARHLALAATTGDRTTLQALDIAAEAAQMRGAPAAAAELLDLAVRLGGDAPKRRIRSARHHFDAGDAASARDILEKTIEGLGRGKLRAEALSLLAVIRLYGDGYLEAADLLQRALKEVGGRLDLKVPVLVTLSWALFNAGRLDEAVVTVDGAVACAERLGQPQPLSQALSMAALMRFMHGEGFDEPGMRRALELADDQRANVPMPFRPKVQNALLLAFTGQLEQGRQQMRSIRRDAMEAGEEGELIVVTFHSFLVECWLGNFTEAHLVAEDAMEIALQQAGDLTQISSLTVRAWLAAYEGRESDARRDIADALAASQRSGTFRLAQWATTVLGFLEVSLGDYAAALDVLEPLLKKLEAAPESTEIVDASFVPDAAEALVQLRRLPEVETLADRLERNGRRLDRAWMLAIGARCRAMLLAARGDIDSAVEAAEQAIAQHGRLAMPFEKARTLLLLGQLQRRQRKKEAAASTLGEALGVFEKLDIPLWAGRAREELARTNVGRQKSGDLTASEQRVAELAASGMTTREVATTLFISPKTVEANLARVYRKLGIHSRAELGQHMSRPVESRQAEMKPRGGGEALRRHPGAVAGLSHDLRRRGREHAEEHRVGGHRDDSE